MSQMVPNYCHTDSPGEAQLFKILRDDPRTRGWIVLHSLHIAQHVSKARGEADFVILIPGRGVVVLEVKSHRRISVQRGTWYFGERREAAESPFVQVEKAMFSIRNHLNADPNIGQRVPIIDLCWFTSIGRDSIANSETIEWQPWQLLDFSDLANAVAAIEAAFDQGVAHLRAKARIRVVGDAITRALLERVRDSLRPNYEFSLSEKQSREARRAELIQYAQEQFVVLDTLADNPRVLVKGPAGTGKTLLAIEAAQRAASGGKKTALICFNRLLSRELRASMVTSGCYVNTMDGLCAELAKEVAGDSKARPLELEYQDLLVHLEPRFDVIVLDEGQDLLRPVFLAILDRLLYGGLSGGSWSIFGDFDGQAIFGSAASLAHLESYCSAWSVGRLTRNCRNVQEIGHFAANLIPTAPKWQSFLRPVAGVDPVMRTIAPGASLIQAFDEEIDLLRSSGFSLDDIVVLSPSEFAEPESTMRNSEYSRRMATFDMARSGQLRFSTIGKYKGLDAPCVLALDVETCLDWSNGPELMYVLITRARDRLTLIGSPEMGTKLAKVTFGGRGEGT